MNAFQFLEARRDQLAEEASQADRNIMACVGIIILANVLELTVGVPIAQHIDTAVAVAGVAGGEGNVIRKRNRNRRAASIGQFLHEQRTRAFSPNVELSESE